MRTAFRGNERRGELQRVGRPQRMHAQEPDCIFTDKLARFDLVPGVRTAPKGKAGRSPRRGNRVNA